MTLIFWGNGARGEACLDALVASGRTVDLVVARPDLKGTGVLTRRARALGLPLVTPKDPNDEAFIADLAVRRPEMFVLAGYGPILKAPLIEMPRLGALNLHGGRLPEYRGSSPMNWALINGDEFFGLSVILMMPGVDTGDVVMERSFPIAIDDTIVDLHEIANSNFPEMMLEAVAALESGKISRRKQSDAGARYFPLRFPDDGLILWDMLDAGQVHNRIRALTEPYPCAFSYYEGREVVLLASALHERAFFGEPGRIYQIGPRGLLVCARDRGLWVTKAVYRDNGESVLTGVERYRKFATVSEAAHKMILSGIRK